MRLYLTAALVFICAGLVALAQSDRGSITGAISDPAVAVVAGASIEARHVETGTVYPAASTSTGNYTLSQLPTGTYAVSVTVPGFKKYVRQGLVVEVAQIVRVDVNLEVGANTESVTVNEAAPLLKTESGELSHNVSIDNLDNLPVLGIGASQAGSEGIRNPAAATLLIPGTTYVANSVIRVNGAQGNTNTFRIEGQDATNGYLDGFNQHMQPSVDAIQEISIQTSNFAAEYGQVGGGQFNLTMRSGTNRYHGSAYDYFVNEALNAGQPFTNGPKGLLRPAQRRNDYGFTLGGPVAIPHLYNGHDKTFFFFNWEQFRETQNINTQALTIPIAAYRTGDFSRALTGRTLSTDPLGRPILENTIYDPNTERLAPNGQVVRDVFPGNLIPAARLDPVAMKIQSLIPQPTLPGLVNNGIYPYLTQRVTSIPALKIDHALSSKAKISFYWSRLSTGSARPPGGGQADGLPEPITATKEMFITSQTERLNFDYTLTPTLLLHWGAGYADLTSNSITAVTNFNSATDLGLTGIPIAGQFPKLQGLTAAQGGMTIMGPNDGAFDRFAKPTANATLTWVKNNHTYKAGAEMRLEGYPAFIRTNTNGFFNFSINETGLPSTQGQNLSGGAVGFPYASFLLGSVDTVNVTQPPDFRLGRQQWGFFIQDSWKITRKLTVDYGLRYDYQTYLQETYGRLLNFSAVTANPTAGGRLGGVIFEGGGLGRCNCQFGKNYPLAGAPRLGLAYQITPKTVLRAGWGIVYGATADANGATGALQLSSPVSNPAFDEPVMTLRTGVPVADQYQWPNFDPGQFPKVGALNTPPVAFDNNAGRPPRQDQWSVGLQREVVRSLMVEASYVGNRGVWWDAPGLISPNALTPQILASYGLNVNNPADRTLLNSPLNSATAATRGFNKLPYSGFPSTATVAQSLRPFPQFGTLTYWNSPLGKTWYDSLQMKATKRLSHGLNLTSVFSWQKQLAMGSANAPTSGSAGTNPVNDVFNRSLNKYLSPYDQPFVFNTSLSYTAPVLKTNKLVSWAVRDWTAGAFLQYSSGLPILAPASNNALSTVAFQTTYANRVPGVPLFTQNLNCHCFNPGTTFTLNPAAWTDPPAGQFGTSSAYYGDYRYQRRPQESLSLGRTFRLAEKATFNIRAEFTNAFNRTEMNNPTSTNALATQTRNAAGAATAGFGWINTTSVFAPARQGTIVGRFQF